MAYLLPERVRTVDSIEIVIFKYVTIIDHQILNRFLYNLESNSRAAMPSRIDIPSKAHYNVYFVVSYCDDPVLINFRSRQLTKQIALIDSKVSNKHFEAT